MQGGGQPLHDPGQKHLAIHGALKKPRSTRTLQAHAGNQRAGLIMPVRDARQQAFVPPGSGRASVSFWYWPRFHPQKPDPRRRFGSQMFMPASFFFGDVRPVLFGGEQSFFYIANPVCRSDKSMVEVRKGRSRRAPNSVKVASGCWDSSFCSRSLRCAVSNVLSSTQMRLGLERAPLLEPLPHPAYRRHAKLQEFGDLSSALALLIKLKNTLTHRQWYGSHDPTLCLLPSPFVKLHF